MSQDSNHYDKYKKFLTPELKSRIDAVYEVETRFAIIMTISNFGSANIKRIGKLLSKNNATIHHHIQWLVDEKQGPPMLEIDTKMTQSKRGIYYALTAEGTRVFGEPPSDVLESKMIPKLDELLSQPDEKISKFLINLLMGNPTISEMRKQENQRLRYNHFLENLMLNNLEEAYLSLKEGKKPVNESYPLGSISNYDLTLDVSKSRHLFEVMKTVNEFSDQFEKLAVKIKNEMDEEGIPEKDRIPLRYHIVGGEIAEFQFK